MALKHVNAVIVGSGAGGGVVAKELATAGLSVVLLERGKWYSAADCRKDDLRNQRTSRPRQRLRPGRRAQPARARGRGRPRARVGAPARAATATTPPASAAAPSATAPWPGASWRRTSGCGPPTEPSKEARWTTGPSATTTWSRTTRRPSGRWASPATTPATSSRLRATKPLPMPPFPPNREHQVLHPAAKRLGLHPFDIPMLRNTVPYNGRGPCMRCRWCVGFACEVDARTGTHNTVIPKALATGNCELRTECMVKEILIGRPRPRHGRRVFRCRTAGSSSRRRTW